MQILFIKDKMIYNRYTIAESDYISNINTFIERKKKFNKMNQMEVDFESVFTKNVLISTKQIDILKQILQKYNEVGISNELFELLEELADNIKTVDYLLFIADESPLLSSVKLDLSALEVYNLSEV